MPPKKVSLHDGDRATVAYPACDDAEVNTRAMELVMEEGLRHADASIWRRWNSASTD